MNKTELIEAIAAKTEQSKAATGAFIDAFVDQVRTCAKKGEDITLVGFGTFKSKKRAARTGRNPATGESIKIAAKNVMQFSTSSAFNADLNPKKKK